MALRDMEYDRARLEEPEIAFFVGRNLTERMKVTMRGFLHLTEREKSNVVRLAHFFKCPANAHVTSQSSAAIGRAFKGGDGGNHRNAPGDCITLSVRLDCESVYGVSSLHIAFPPIWMWFSGSARARLLH